MRTRYKNLVRALNYGENYLLAVKLTVRPVSPLTSGAGVAGHLGQSYDHHMDPSLFDPSMMEISDMLISPALVDWVCVA
jgi:hypothetical protein